MLSTDPVFFACAVTIFVVFYSFRSPLLQTIILTVGSFAMYATEGLPFLLLLAASSALTAVCSFLAAGNNPRRAKVAMFAGIAINMAVLAGFKYKQLLVPLHTQPNVSWVQDFLAFGLPIGISFYTFHGVSLVVDAWRNPDILRHRHNFFAHCLDTSLYLSFFPQLVAGPITKGKMFFPQIVAKRLSDVPWADSATNIILGMFLKRVIADNLNPLTIPLTDSRTYAATPHGELLAMMIGYSAQIFADFAGYSLIAIGVAKLFGYRLPDNFNQPYLAVSITDFWRRWHMSLSAWLKEYLYFPLGGNRLGPARTYLNLLIVMGLGGLWHGADWKFAVWGLWHGGLLALERLLGIGEPGHGIVAFARILLTFALVTVGWLFFRLASLSDVGLLLGEFAKPWRPLETGILAFPNVVLIFVLVMMVALFHVPARYEGSFDRWEALQTAFRPYVYAVIFVAFVLRGGIRTTSMQIMVGAIVILFLIPIRYFGSPERWDAQIAAIRPYALGFLFAVILMASGSRHAFIYFQF